VKNEEFFFAFSETTRKRTFCFRALVFWKFQTL